MLMVVQVDKYDDGYDDDYDDDDDDDNDDDDDDDDQNDIDLVEWDVNKYPTLAAQQSDVAALAWNTCGGSARLMSTREGKSGVAAGSRSDAAHPSPERIFM